MRDLTVHELSGLQHVKRWHTRPVGREQTVADHSAVVALLALRVGGDELSDRDKVQVLLLGLLHDAHEARFGDIPYPARMALLALGIDLDAVCEAEFWGSHGPAEGASPLARDLVAVADKLEAALFARTFAQPIAAAIATEAQGVVLDRLKDEHRWSMRSRALAVLKEIAHA